MLKCFPVESFAETSSGLLVTVLDYCLVEGVQVLFQMMYHMFIKYLVESIKYNNFKKITRTQKHSNQHVITDITEKD